MGHLNGAVPQLPGSDPRSVAINAILRRSMAKVPAERHRTAAEFQASCEAAAKLGTSGARTVSPAHSWPAPGSPGSGPQFGSGPHHSHPPFAPGPPTPQERPSTESGKSESVRLYIGGARLIK